MLSAARSQLLNRRDVLPSVHVANQGEKPSLGMHDSRQQGTAASKCSLAVGAQRQKGSVSTGLVRRRIPNVSISARQRPPEELSRGWEAMWRERNQEMRLIE